MPEHQQLHTRRQLLKRGAAGASVVSLSGWLAACSRGGNSGDEAKSTNTDAKLKQGGTLVLGVDALTGNSDPGIFATFGDWMVIDLVARGLTHVDYHTPKIQPALAERWEISADGRTYRFQLKQGLKFHDGKPVTARDAQRSFSRLYNEKDPSRPANTYAIAELGGANFKRARAISDSELEIQLGAPDVAFLSRLSNPNAVILSAAAIEKYGNKIGNNLVAAGPFKFVSSQTNQSTTVAAFDGFYGGRPKLDRVVLQVLPDPTSLTSALRQGSAQLSPFIPFSNVKSLQADKNVNVVEGKPYIDIFLVVNAQGKLVDDLDVRHAVSMAIDRQAIVEQAFSGAAQAATGLVSPAELGHVKAGNLPFGQRDVAQAKQLIQRAGAQGKELTIVNQNILFWPRIGQILDQNLREIGLRPKSLYLDEATYNRRQLDGSYDIAPNQRSAFVADPDNKLSPLLAGDSFVAQSGTRSTKLRPQKELDRRLVAARQEEDQAKRAQMYVDIQRFFAQEMAVLLPMVYISLPIATTSKIGGVNADALGTYRTFLETAGFVA
jgi:peptide/nickel transport system substrate-binding protein